MDETREHGRSYEKAALYLLAAVFVWRVIYVWIAPLDLVADETYYWDWSRHLDWGYYSKPPLIAWLIALSTRILGSTPFAVRLPAAVLGTAAVVVLYALARRMYGRRVAFWAAAVWLATPGSAALGLIMTIDAPLVFFWSVALFAFWRAVERSRGGAWWWLLASLMVGMGLLTKQMMAAFVLLAALFLLASRRGRALLRQPWPYLLLVVPLLLLVPVLRWNAQHDWVTLSHTAHHFAGSRGGPFRFLVTFFEFVGSQLLLASPLTCALGAALMGVLLARLRGQDPRGRYLLLFSALPLVGFLLFSLRQRINPNWAAAFYPAGVVLLAAWGCGAVSGGMRLDRWRGLFVRGVRVGAILAVATYALPFLLLLLSGAGPRKLMARARGWEPLGTEVGKVLRGQPRPSRTFLVATHRQMASPLAFYVAGRQEVYVWPDAGGLVRSQYDLWPGPADKLGWDALVVLEKGHPLPARLARSFAGGVTGPVPLAVEVEGGATREYVTYLAQGLLRWPR